MNKPPRAAKTYRAARRNAARGSVWRGVIPRKRRYHPTVRANRSRRWPSITPQEAELAARGTGRR